MNPKPLFEELDFQKTDLGDLSLRRRTVLALDNLDVYEIVLGEGFLMSSLFTEVEKALANLGLATAAESFRGEALDVVVGGLGLGYTAKAALENSAVRSVTVVDYLKPVIEWHQKGLVPLGAELTEEPRCQLIHGDFFDLALHSGFDPGDRERKFHAVLLDIDHSPKNLLHKDNSVFYRTDGLRKLASRIHPGGVFALWSDDPPEDSFMRALGEVFSTCESHVVPFHNPILDRDSESTVYVAKLDAGTWVRTVGTNG